MTADLEWEYALGTFVGPAAMNMLVELSAEEYASIVESVNSISRLEASFQYRLIENNFRDLEGTFQFVAIMFALGRRFAVPNRQLLTDSLMRVVVNWLTSMRLCLDHEETELKRRYGEKSEQYEVFRSATSEAFDKELGYRFSYKFRNYVQHCGLPLSSIVTRLVSTNGGLKIPNVEILLDRDALLANFAEWGKVKDDLVSMETVFELQPMIEGAMRGLQVVHRATMEIDLNDALSHVRVLTFAVKRAKEAATDGTPAVYRCAKREGGGQVISPTIIPCEAVAQLESVSTGTIARDSLWPDVDISRRPPLPLDPKRVREMLDRDNRGVQMISAFLAEGGTTPAFLQLAGRLVSEDGGVEPLIVGVINVAVVLTHMTAAVLGVSPESLVAGVLKIYGEN